MMNDKNNSQLKKGYKKTDIGIIPEDWEVKTFGEIAFKIIDNRGKTPPNNSNEIIELIETSSISFVQQYPDYSKVTKFVSNEIFENWFRSHPRKGDILVSTVGEYSGASAIMNKNRGTVAQNLIAIRIKINLPMYVFYWTRSLSFTAQLKQVIMNQAQPSLRVPWLLNFELPLPPLPEQKAIAEVLSDTDELIQTLQRQITKKRLIKQGAMQVLLSPPATTQMVNGELSIVNEKEKWEVKKLGEIADIIMGQSPSSSNYNNVGLGLPLIQGNADIKNRKIIIRNFTSQITKVCKNQDIIMTVRAPVGEISISTSVACIGRGVCAIRYKNNYLFHYLIFIEPLWAKHSTGSTFDSVNSETIRNIEISIPKSKTEQTRIATILSDMDSEIEMLESKLVKFKKIKQGMMQELLTGKTRLMVKGKL